MVDSLNGPRIDSGAFGAILAQYQGRAIQSDFSLTAL